MVENYLRIRQVTADRAVDAVKAVLVETSETRPYIRVVNVTAEDTRTVMRVVPVTEARDVSAVRMLIVDEATGAPIGPGATTFPMPGAIFDYIASPQQLYGGAALVNVSGNVYTSVLTNPIPTGVTIVMDATSGTGSSAEVTAGVDAGGISSRTYLGRSGTGNVTANMFNASVSQAAPSGGVWAISTRIKAAMSAAENDVRIAVGGVLGGTPDTLGTWPGTMVMATLAGLRSGGSAFTGTLHRMTIFPGVYTDAELQALSNGTIPTELLSNGALATDTVWIKGSGWTISGGVATRIADAGNTSVNQPITPVVGGTYRVTFEVKTWSAGNFTPGFQGGTVVSGAARSAVGVYSETLVAVTGNNVFRIQANAAAVGSVDNISLVRLS